MGTLRLIASGAYVDQELSAEFGALPPAFLPIGVSRLFEAQIAALGPGGPLHLTLPESFVLAPSDRRRLEELDVTVVPVPEGLRLGESIVYAINFIGVPLGGVELLHGDTLIEDIPSGDDLIALSHEGDDYSWAIAEVEDGRIVKLKTLLAGTANAILRPVVCGYFAFSSAALLVRCITRARGDFIGGLNLYADSRPVAAGFVSKWRDFGHIQTYFRSRRDVTTSRVFNSLRIDACAVWKSSADEAKMQAEANWLRSLPPAASPYSARLLDAGFENGRAFYTTEYQYAPTVADLLVFSEIGRPTWRTILRSCADFLTACASCKGPGSADDALRELAIHKTGERLERFASQTGFDISASNRLDGLSLPSLTRISEDIAQAIELQTGRPQNVMHGDFCFSNILYNSRSGRIVAIDPRGHVAAGAPTLFGDTRYDLAKLSHSISGHYDQILAGRYRLERHGEHDMAISFEVGPHVPWLQGMLADFEVDGVRADSLSVKATTVALFLSMLPLHSDRPDRQMAFIANTLRLYSELEKGVA